MQEHFEIYEVLFKCKVLGINKEIHNLIYIEDSTISNIKVILIIIFTTDKHVDQYFLILLDSKTHPEVLV